MYDYEYDEFYGWVGLLYDEDFDRYIIVTYFDNEYEAEQWFIRKNGYSI